MAKTYQVVVFGKNGCPKCKVLNSRVDTLLQKEVWADFEKVYQSLDSEEGLVCFCKTECINPQRIPALAIARGKSGAAGWHFLPAPEPGRADGLFGHSHLYHLVGLQTDYSERGKGVISPKMIEAVFEEARRA